MKVFQPWVLLSSHHDAIYLQDTLQNAPEKIDTMERLFKYSSKIYSDRKCLGTRQVLGELEEKQESGKVFTKLRLGEYTWQTYSDVATQAERLGKGLRELGMAPKDKVRLRMIQSLYAYINI